MMDYLINNNGGIVFAVLGMAMATILLGLDQPKGLALLKQQRSFNDGAARKIWSSVNFTVITGTQGLYGFVIAFLIYINLGNDMSMVQGLNYFVATLPIAFAGLFSGIAQGRVALCGDPNFSEETRTCNKRNYLSLPWLKLMPS